MCAHGLTTGISAEERTNTVRALANPNSGAADFVRPGHVFPLVAREGGVLMRSGHTEACVDLCRLAGLPPVGVLSELMNDDGTVMRGAEVARFAEKHGLKRLTIADLIAYRQVREKLVERVGEFSVATEIGTLKGYAYVTPFDKVHHMALVHGRIGDGLDVPTRLHRANILRDIFGGAADVHGALKRFARDGRGVIVILRDGSAGVPVSALPHDGEHEFGGGTATPVARNRPRRPDFEGPWHFLDPAAHLRGAPLCRPRRLRHRDRRKRADRVTATRHKAPAPLGPPSHCHRRPIGHSAVPDRGNALEEPAMKLGVGMLAATAAVMLGGLSHAADSDKFLVRGEAAKSSWRRTRSMSPPPRR